MKTITSKATVSLGILLLTACATGPVKPTYVSPVKYQNLDCTQLLSEYKRLTQYLQNGVEAPSSVFSNVGVGLAGAIGRGGGIFPTVQVNMGQSKTNERTVMAQMLGERDAVAEASRYKHCGFLLENPAAANTAKP